MREFESLTQEEKDEIVRQLIFKKKAVLFPDVVLAGHKINEILDFGDPKLRSYEIEQWKSHLNLSRQLGEEKKAENLPDLPQRRLPPKTGLFK